MERVGRNLIRGTANIVFVASGESSQNDGTWEYRDVKDADSISVTQLIDAPVPNIKRGVKVINSEAGKKYIDIFQRNVSVINNCIYTMSAWIRGTGQYAFWISGGASFIDDRFYTVNEEDNDKWIHISKRIITTASTLGSYMIGSNSNYEICGLKFERGDTATPWSPAPEDSPSFAQCYLPRRASGRSIKKAVVELDRNSWTYDGSEHVPKVTSVTLNGKALVEGKDYTCAYTPETDAGSYYVLVKGAKSYKGTIAAPWKIEKAAGSVRVEPSSVAVYGVAGSTKTAELIVVGDGEITFGASDYVTLSREGSALTVTAVADGSGTVDVILKDGRNYTGARTSLNVDITLVDSVFEDNTWDTIAAVCAAGKAQEFWRIGDEKAFTRNGTTYHFQIGDFDHDDLDPTDARYDDPTYNGGRNKAAITLIMKEVFATKERMYRYDNNTCGWHNSEMRVTTIPQIKSEINQDLISVIRTVTKKTSQGGGSSTIVNTADDFFLMSYIEVFGRQNHTASGEGSRYAFFGSGNSRIKYREGSAEAYWLRSPITVNSYYFEYVDSKGEEGSTAIYSDKGNGVVLCACI